jgi:hypothetical protein
LPFTNVGEEARKLRIGESLSSLIVQRLTLEKKVRVAETQDIDRILQEIRLGTLGLVDNKSAVEVGNLVGAQLMLSGTVLPAGENYQVAVRLNDVRTAQTLGAVTVNVPRRRMIALSRDIYNIHQGWYEAPLRSLLVPGWGHFYNERPVRGTLYFTGVVAALSGSAIAAYAANHSLENYRNANERVEAKYDSYRQAVRVSDGLLIAGAALWTLNVVDAGVSGPVEDVTVAVTPSEVRFALRF